MLCQPLATFPSLRITASDADSATACAGGMLVL
jgi:hypothetical protein